MKLAAQKRIGRREFIRNTSATSFAALVGMRIPYLSLLPAGLAPIALTHAAQATIIPQKPGLVVLNDRPLNAETPAHLLDDAITPAARMFVRNNGIPPQLTAAQVADWTLRIGGESCTRTTQLSLRDLQQKFQHHTYQLQLECGGNGRSEFFPPARGNQWSTGAVCCAQWTGVRLRDVLQHCGIRNDAVYIGYNSADSHLSGDPKLRPISRGVPIDKALEDETLIAWALNGADIPPLHGYPLRLVCGGWPASASGKWLNEILVRDRVHDGAKMTGSAYRVPCTPVAPGTKVPDAHMCIIQSMPVKSLVTFPKSGIQHRLNEPLNIRGHAWAGDRTVSTMAISTDFGATWQNCDLQPPANRLAWQQWSTEVTFVQTGYFEIWARATDDQGHSQPMVVPGWNPKGYLNNASHRIAVAVV
jgi:DMSO/TMAO reductase YedYZ molybdopterin-dependent catalytic subunit